MQNSYVTKTTRIYQLPKAIQEEIEKDVRNALADQTNNYEEMINEALEGRLCDIEDLIYIDKYLVE